MTSPVEDRDEAISHHYVLVLVVEVVTLTALYFLSRFFR